MIYPAPWMPIAGSFGVTRIISNQGRNDNIGSVAEVCNDWADAQDHIRLICAAPDLMRILEVELDAADEYIRAKNGRMRSPEFQKRFDEARALIAKIKGRAP